MHVHLRCWTLNVLGTDLFGFERRCLRADLRAARPVRCQELRETFKFRVIVGMGEKDPEAGR